MERAFGPRVDYATMEKAHRLDENSSPCVVVEKRVRAGHPDPERISTSLVERQNLTMRMGMRRFTRRTNGFSKRIRNHYLLCALFFAYYNFIRIHRTLRCTPAMEIGCSASCSSKTAHCGTC